MKATIQSKENEDISIQIQVANHPGNYVVDCGEASGYTIKEIQQTKAIFISHCHIDHFIGFDTFIRHQLGTGERIVVCGPTGIAKQVQAKLQAYTWNLAKEKDLSYEIREIHSKTEILRYELNAPDWELKILEKKNEAFLYQNEAFHVQFCILDHKTNSIAYRFNLWDSTQMQMKNSPYPAGPWIGELKKAFAHPEKEVVLEVHGKKIAAKDLFHLMESKKGKSIAIVMDHAANPENHQQIAALCAGVDELYIECFYTDEDQEFAQTNYHSYVSASAAIAKKSNVGKAIPIHFSRKYSAETIQIIYDTFYALVK